MKFYISYYIKNEPKQTKFFDSWDDGMKFAVTLDSDKNLDSRTLLKRIK